MGWLPTQNSRPLLLTLHAKLKLVSWPKAIIGMVVTCVLALSVHVIMLQALHIPYPADYPTTGWPIFANWFFTALGLLIVYHLCYQELARFSLLLRWLMVFLLTAMLREALFRLPIMNGIATTAWAYSMIESVFRLMPILWVSGLVVGIGSRLRQFPQYLLGALLIATLLQILGLPLIDRSVGRLLISMAYLNHEEVYKVPYGWQIQVPAYITYLEPVSVCFLLMALVWDRLPGNNWKKTGQFVLLVLMINRTFVRPFIYIFYAKFGVITALLSQGQFFLEALALGLLTSLTWRWSQASTGAVDTAAQSPSK